MFNTEPPTIEEYLPLNEDITPLKEGGDKVQLSYTYDYGGRCVWYNQDEEIQIDPEPGSLFFEL